MEPHTSGQTTEPLRVDTEGDSVFLAEDFDKAWLNGQDVDVDTVAGEVARLDAMTDAELLVEAGIEPVVSTTEAAEYFDRTSQWIYWGFKPDTSGKPVFVWPDGSAIVPDRVGEGLSAKRRFTPTILRGILAACYRRGNITDDELKVIIRRIRYTELGVEWRQREGWRYVDLGRNRHRWVKPEHAYMDTHNKVWKLRKERRESV